MYRSRQEQRPYSLEMCNLYRENTLAGTHCRRGAVLGGDGGVDDLAVGVFQQDEAVVERALECPATVEGLIACEGAVIERARVHPTAVSATKSGLC